MAEDLKKMYRTIVADHFPPRMEISFVDADSRQTLIYEKVLWTIEDEQKGLRYGENPGQEAALYRLVNGNLVMGETEMIQPGRYLASDIELLQSGKHPGKTNLTDADNALNILRYFTDRPTVVIVKHNNPCGVARADTFIATAEAISEQYAEVVVAPEFEGGVMDIFSRKKNLRIIRIGNISRLQTFVGQRVVEFKTLIDGGVIAQWSFVPVSRSKENLIPAQCEYQGRAYKVNRAPTDQEYEDLIFGWLVESGITSNSVIYVKDQVTVGIGTGEQDRVGVAEIARDKAYRKLADRYCFLEYGIPYNDLTDVDKKAAVDQRVAREKGGLIGAAMVSDAFFPFRDGVDVGIREGIRAVIQPGGSANDYQVIEACNEANVTMVFTGQRSFKH